MDKCSRLFLGLSLIFVWSVDGQSIIDISISNSTRELEDERSRFSLEHLVDKTLSPWCISGKDWTNEDNIEIILDKKTTISQIQIANGFFDPKLFQLNSRPSKVSLKSELGEKRDLILKDTLNVESYSFAPISGSTITLYFPEIKKGSKYNDLCITEISFLPIENSALISNRKLKHEKAVETVKKPMLFKSVQGDENDSFTIKPSGDSFNLETKSKTQKSIILYQPMAIFSLILSPPPKIVLMPKVNPYDLLKIKIEGSCTESMDKKKKTEPCKLIFNPEDGNYTVYIKNKLTFHSKYPEMFQ
ncbi:hypothetical protein EHQ58_17375 [Leptospira ognonensis]|uniref:NAD glycohydrolase translocation F5/8 type C domain-containing protein n=1 Tax=Leptospira ognonensis TaxID=2484945 RepID=A0A4R9JWI4_9LEPT|nr:hypothetical protein [Leptospira ognonensis]TGL56394.1 hypothetical protein EHQ58_17375 [Leptospira ognonensis]